MLRRSSNRFAIRLPFIRCLCRCGIERSLGLHDGKPRVVIRIVFIFRAVVGDALNHYFGIVAAGQGALRIRSIVLGLALVPATYGP